MRLLPVALLAFLIVNGASEASTYTPMPAKLFTSSIGMNTHLGWAGYTPLSLAETELAYVGVKRVRDEAVTVAILNLYLQLYNDTGIKLTESVNPSAGDSYASQLAFIQSNRKIFNYIEGPNEPDGAFPITWNGLTGAQGASQFAKQLFTDISPMCTPPLVTASVGTNTNFTTYGPQVGCQAENIHAYTQYSLSPSPFQLISNAISYYSPNCPGGPFIITETGNWTTPCATGQPQTVQAKYILDAPFDAIMLGAKEVDIYELNDQITDPTCTTQEYHFGLFNYDGTHKTSADTFHNMMTLLTDTASITPTTLTYSFGSTFPQYGQSLLLQKSDGNWWLAVWNDAQIWDNSGFTPITVNPVSVTLTLGITASSIVVYDPLIGTTAQATTLNASSASISVPDHVILVNVIP